MLGNHDGRGMCAGPGCRWTGPGRRVAPFARSMASVLLLLALFARPVCAGTPLEGRLIIASSFPQPVFTPFVENFRGRHPQLDVHVRYRKTPALIAFVQDEGRATVDLVWASAPDAFELLEQTGYLEPGPLPERPGRIAGYPLDDPDGYYRGFAVSGYGLMWNESYLQRHLLPRPERWDDLRAPGYRGHVGISAPSRSGTTHVMVELLLQSLGWEAGWALLLEVGGNLATVTARSTGVPASVAAGHFGIGFVVDYLALAARDTNEAVRFVYPQSTTFLPASIAMTRRRQNDEAARAFMAFVLSDEGQRLLLAPGVRRLPVRPEVYAAAGPDYPNPFDDRLASRTGRYDSELSRRRYNLVNVLFDALVTKRVRELRKAWTAIHAAEQGLTAQTPAAFRAQVAEARRLASSVPVSAEQAGDPAFTGCFVTRRPGIPVPPCQAAFEREWARQANLSATERVLALTGGGAGSSGGADL